MWICTAKSPHRCLREPGLWFLSCHSVPSNHIRLSLSSSKCSFLQISLSYSHIPAIASGLNSIAAISPHSWTLPRFGIRPDCSAVFLHWLRSVELCPLQSFLFLVRYLHEMLYAVNRFLPLLQLHQQRGPICLRHLHCLLSSSFCN